MKANEGAAGVDGMTVAELRPWIAGNRETADRRHCSTAATSRNRCAGCKSPNRAAGNANLGIPTVVDRLVQQAIAQVLEPILDPTFSGSSFGFRPGRSAHQALRQAREYVADGYEIVVD